MLTQLLARRGLASRHVPHSAVSREAIEQAELEGVAAAVVSYLELEGMPTRLRSLVKRLRTRLPDATIIVGLWPEGDAALSDADAQRLLAADAYVGSLRAAVEAAVRTRPARPPASAAPT
jgi:methylmalonyl-CoA mutase cobalamin-binding subunit